MTNNTGHPECKILVYQLNEISGYYEIATAPLGFYKLPGELKVEETRQPDQIKSKMICRGRVKEGKYLFFTGLLPTGNGTLFFGDHYEFIKGQKKNSFILFKFTSDRRNLKIYYFNHFKLYPAKRGQFIINFIQSL